MYGYINSDQFRKHPTGGIGLVKILKFLFLIGSIIGAGMVIASLVAMSKGDVSLFVVTKKATLGDVIGNGFRIEKMRQTGIIKFEITNALD